LILLLVSADFLASDYCYGEETYRAMQRYRQREARVIPIILRPCDWEHSLFSVLQALPIGAKPITLWPHQDKAFYDVVQGIHQVIKEWQ
jgi:hypothetical protein